MKHLFLLLLFITPTACLRANDTAEEQGYVRSPNAVTNGIVFTDNYGSSICLRTPDGVIRVLAASPGAGTYYAVSPDKRTIGFKRIDENGLQAPAIIDAVSGSLRLLASPSRRAGQVSFLADGRYAFTLGDTLVVTDGFTELRVDLGTYANIAPVSRDGRTAVFNDASDRLWMIDLGTRVKTLITGGTHASFGPQWSPEGRKILYSTLDGHLFVYELQTTATAALGEGYDPAWSPDGTEIAFYKKEIAGDSLINADIYIASADGRSVRQATFTPDICEMDPSFGLSASELVYETYARSEVGTVTISAGVQRAQSLPHLIPVKIQPKFTAMRQASASTQLVDVPELNQVYDTPDWFNGRSACGPTTAMMALAYYNILPPWTTSCSTPTYHTNNWGNYISESYTFHGITYAASANDPNGRPAQGAFGYMWSSGSPYSMMSTYYANHGMQSTTIDAPEHAAAVAEISSGHVYSICNGLTTAGHIVLAHDVDAAESHSIIVNDPYGNKNKPGYPNNYGKDATYDWPGYNNGNQNFNTVYWAATVRYTAPPPADSVVDDLQLDNGFFINTKSPASMALWKFKTTGYKNHFWFIFTTASQDIDTCYAVWTPTLDRDGRYEVFAYLPHYNGLYSTVAKYKIHSTTGVQTVVIDQRAINTVSTQDTLVSLGTYDFSKGSAGSVRLGDATGIKNEVLIYDAMMWKYRGASVTSVAGEGMLPAHFALVQNFPNPFNPSTTITFSLPTTSEVSLEVLDVLGRRVAVLAKGEMNGGTHTVRWDAGSAAGGVYFCRLSVVSASAGRAVQFTDVKKLLLAK